GSGSVARLKAHFGSGRLRAHAAISALHTARAKNLVTVAMCRGRRKPEAPSTDAMICSTSGPRPTIGNPALPSAVYITAETGSCANAYEGARNQSWRGGVTWTALRGSDEQLMGCPPEPCVPRHAPEPLRL